eukprot:TRINITY_DN2345_c0_g1_i2.p1 TRINITY_DN2345_c0_g1~~TRINITY_DN2345_c0_g1_i2.p1  ORF type:complete len:359 (+),score=78.09 TRINITY_DN2345_c0_g1_i2:422-1498(+)
MGIKGLTIYHVKSHLQKYRLAKYIPDSFDGGKCDKRKGTETAPSSEENSGLQISEAFQMQMEVQKRLHEQLEVQRQLQQRIEAQGRYLQKIIEEQQRVGTNKSETSSSPESSPCNHEEFDGTREKDFYDTGELGNSDKLKSRGNQDTAASNKQVESTVKSKSDSVSNPKEDLLYQTTFKDNTVDSGLCTEQESLPYAKRVRINASAVDPKLEHISSPHRGKRHDFSVSYTSHGSIQEGESISGSAYASSLVNYGHRADNSLFSKHSADLQDQQTSETIPTSCLGLGSQEREFYRPFSTTNMTGSMGFISPGIHIEVPECLSVHNFPVASKAEFPNGSENHGDGNNVRTSSALLFPSWR